MNPHLIRALVLGITLLAWPRQLWAQVAPLARDKCRLLGLRCTDATTDTVFNSILDAINILLGFIGLVAVIVFIYGGLLYLLSGGDEDKAKKGKQVVIYGIIGLILIGFSVVLVNLVFSIFT